MFRLAGMSSSIIRESRTDKGASTGMDTRASIRRTRHALLGALALLLLLGTLQAQAAAPLRVSFIPSRDTPLYQTVIDGAREAMAGLRPAPAIRVIALASFQNQAASVEAASDLLVPIGIQATKVVLQYSTRTDILATLVPYASLRANHARFAAPTAGSQRRIGAVLLDQPLDRQLLLAEVLLGPTQQIGTLLGPLSGKQRTALQLAAHRLGLLLVSSEVSDESELMPALSRLLARSDVLLALPDPLVFNRRNLRNILLSTYRQRIPVIGFSRAMVRAGALAAVYSTPEEIGRQTGQILADLQRRPQTPLPATVRPRKFEVAINAQVARSFGLGAIDGKQVARQIQQREAEQQP